MSILDWSWIQKSIGPCPLFNSGYRRTAAGENVKSITFEVCRLWPYLEKDTATTLQKLRRNQLAVDPNGNQPCPFPVPSPGRHPHPPPHHHHPTLPPPTHAHRAMKKSPRFHQSRPASRSHHRIELALNPRRSMHPNGEDWSRLRRLSKGVQCLFPRTTVVVLYAFCTIPQIPKSCPCGRLVVGDGFP